MTSRGLALNVFLDDVTQHWHFTIYNDTTDGIETSHYLSIDPSDEQIERYLEISEDDDWWTFDYESDFKYILRGE